MSKPCDTNFVILIPARKGSKGVPFKNRKLLGYTLESIPSEYHQYIYVSTDDEEIKRTCEQRNIKVHERNPIHATDTASIKQPVHEFIHKKRISKTVIMLYLTYPERTWDDVVKAYNFYKRHKATSLLCRKEISQHPYLMMKEKDGIFGEQIVKHNLYRRQEYPTCFEICHYVSIFEPWKFRELNSNMYNEKTIFFPIKSPIDVDENKDLEKFIENKDTPEMNNVKPTISPTKKSNVLYKDFIKNKNVIIVGPSRNLLGTNLGATIDGYDVVIRTNGAFPVQDGYKKDYGARCDVLYTNAYFSKNEIHKKIVEYERNGLNYIIHKISNKQIHQKNTNIQLNAWRAYNPKELTGIHIIKEMIQYGAKSITYAGMDFYMDKNNRYLDNYLPKGFKYDEEREHRIHDIKGSILFIKDLEKKGIIKKLVAPKNPIIKKSIDKVLFMITTYNRKESLKKTIDSWTDTRNTNYSWTLLIADDGSTDGTLEYLENLKIPNVDIKIIKNKKQGVHFQTNSLIKEALKLKFDYGFKSDDDVIFAKKGWDDLYINASITSGFYHLIHCNKEWAKKKNHNSKSIFSCDNLLEFSVVKNIRIQGALFTFNRDVLDAVGYFDTKNFGVFGVGHIDFSLRACRAGYNKLDTPFDAADSNNYIKFNDVPTTRTKNKRDSIRELNRKFDLAQTNRIFVDPTGMRKGAYKKVLVIMAAHNAAKFIEKSIDSVLKQTHKNLILCIVDDCSTDNTYDIISKIAKKDDRIHVYKNSENKGAYYSRNVGLYYHIDEADFWTIHDADDIMFPERIAKQLNKSNEFLAVSCYYNRYDKNNKLLRTNKGDHSNILYNKKIFDKIGYYDYSTRFGADSEYSERMKCTFKNEFYVVPEVLFNAYSYENNETIKNPIKSPQRIKYIDSYQKKHKLLSPDTCFYNFNIDCKIMIIMPVFNNYDYITESVESILNQSYQNFHLFLVDDASTDKRVLSLLEKFSTHPKITLYKSNKNVGAYINRNTILNEHMHEFDFWTMQDSDDASDKTRLETCIKKIKHFNAIGTLGYYLKNNEITSITKEPVMCSIMFRNDVFKKLGFYFEDTIGADRDYIQRLEEADPTGYIKTDDILYTIRMHDKQTTFFEPINNERTIQFHKDRLKERILMKQKNNFYRKMSFEYSIKNNIIYYAQ